MACNDRQLTQAQREEAFTQQRTAGVVRAARPFSGEATPENLVDYLNREVYPALRANREKLNDVYRQVTDNAPSANPLGYYFSTELASGADPTTGRLRLGVSLPQNGSTVISLSQQNGRAQDVAVWLDVMAGSITVPLGTVTLYDAIDPSRFLRFELDAMTDQGAYWDLAVTFAESSHDNPFVDGEAIFLSFIPGATPSGTVVPVGSLGPIAQSRILGRAEGAGTGDVTELTPTQVVAVIDGENATWTGAHSFTGASHTVNVTGAASITAGTTASITTTTGDINLTPGDDLVVTAADFVAIAATAGSVQFNAGVDVIAIATDDVILTASDNIALTAGTSITAASTADILLNATDGLGVAAGFSVANVATGDVVVNATSGIGIFAGFASAETSISADDISIGGDSGVAITAGIAAVTNVAAGILLSTANSITATTNSVERLEIESTGAWQLGGDVGTSGAVLTSRGSGTPPVWQVGSSNKSLCQWWEDFEFITQATLPGIFFAGSSGSWQMSLAGAAGGSSSVIAAEAGHPGIVRLTTHTVSGTLISLYRGSTNTTAPVGTAWVRGDQILRFEAVVRPTLTETKGLLIGFAEDVSSIITTGVGQSHIMAFMFDSANALLDVNIQCVTRESDGTAVINDSGISMTSIHGTWITLEIRQTTLGTVEFLINESVVATHTTQVPDSETLNCGLTVLTRAASATALDIDYVSFISHPLDRTAG